VTETTSHESSRASFFSNPIVGIIGWIATVLGLLLTIYFYIEGKESPQLTFYVNPIKAVVVRANQASRLSASFDNKIIRLSKLILQRRKSPYGIKVRKQSKKTMC